MEQEILVSMFSVDEKPNPGEQVLLISPIATDRGSEYCYDLVTYHVKGEKLSCGWEKGTDLFEMIACPEKEKFYTVEEDGFYESYEDNDGYTVWYRIKEGFNAWVRLP